MSERIIAAHTGLSVTYDDYTGMINTILLVAALFLSFVSATVTVCGEDQYLKADLEHCRRGWAHRLTCVDLDVAGYFGTINATGLLTTADTTPTDSAARLLRATKGGPTSTSPGWMAPVNMNRLTYHTWFDSPSMTSGNELPSFGVAFYGAGSIGLLGLVTMFGFVQYLFLGESFNISCAVVFSSRKTKVF